jgi:dihydroorotate dehydrogenase electron transfer subunit
MLGLPGDTAPLLRRPFSVLSQDSSRRSLEILYSVEGAGTRALSELTRGRELSLLGPLGTHFPAAEVADGSRAVAVGGGTATLHVLVAGGRGIAPLTFHAGSITSSRARSSSRVLFLAGARTAADLALLDRVKAMEVFVSTDDGTQGRKGTVIQLLKSLERQIDSVRQDKGGAVGARPQAVLYGCGPAGMLSALHSYAVSKGLPCFVSLEARMACGLGLCQGCAVRLTGSRYALVCKDGPVFESGAVDWARYGGA